MGEDFVRESPPKTRLRELLRMHLLLEPARQTHIRGILLDTWPVFPKTAKVLNNAERPRNEPDRRRLGRLDN